MVDIDGSWDGYDMEFCLFQFGLIVSKFHRRGFDYFIAHFVRRIDAGFV